VSSVTIGRIQRFKEKLQNFVETYIKVMKRESSGEGKVKNKSDAANRINKLLIAINVIFSKRKTLEDGFLVVETFTKIEPGHLN